MIRLAQLLNPPRDSLSQPLDHLTACHRRIEERLDLFVRAGEAYESAPGEAIEAMHSACRFMDMSGELHTKDEEQSLFPRLAGHLNEEEERFVAGLEEDHRRAEALYAQLKEAMASLPESLAGYQRIARAMRDIYAAHIAAEDEHLIALGRRTLTTGQLAEVAAEMRARRQP